MEYKEFIASKAAKTLSLGIDISDITINPKLFGHQQYIVKKALQRGRCAVFADTGLGKSLTEIEFAHHVSIHTGKPVLILTPLCVASQICDEGLRFGYNMLLHAIPDPNTQGTLADRISPRAYGKTENDPNPIRTSSIVVTNYEKLHHYNASDFGGIVLDESSILKSENGEYKKALTEFAANIHFRMTASATPSPNDHMELGTQCEFLGVLTRTEMLATFFTHDGGETSKWRLKGHGRSEFWKWLSTWAIAVRKPSDLGFDDSGYDLKPLNIHEITVEAPNDGLDTLFAMDAQSLNERRKAKKDTLEDRIKACADLVNNSDEQWLVWCNLNCESDALKKAIHGTFEVKGSDSSDHKESVADGFKNGDVRVLISKPSIFGFGLNFQNCHNMAFVGLSDSFEQTYQAIKRCHRFGQTEEVNVYMISANTEGNIKKNIDRKQKQHDQMYDEMIASMKEFGDDSQTDLIDTSYSTNTANGRNWELHLGDCVEEMAKFPDESIDYSIFSPPFASLYTFSSSDRDMSNCKDYQDFLTHFRFLAIELFRVLKTGRLLSFHCMNLTLSKASNGFMGIKDFRGDLIRIFEEVGFVQHSEVVIWKDPIIAMQRTKAIGLLHKQVMKDSTVSRQASPDYLITMGKRGINQEPVSGLLDHYVGDNDPTQGDDAYRNSINIWSKYASPVWMDINPSDTLQREGAKENDDERHISLLQLEVIHRALQLWTNPNDVVLSPFAGICSEGYESLKMGRRFKGIELKKSYFNMGVKNLKAVEMAPQQMDLLSMVA